MIRSLLFLPGNSARMLDKGPFLNADGVILDLEDAVAPTEKDAARILVRNALAAVDFRGRKVVVRINSISENGFWKEDLREIVPLRPDFIMPPKTSTPEDVLTISREIDALEEEHGLPAGAIRLIPLLETCLGIENAFSIATASPRIYALFLGAEDLTADMHSVRTKEGNVIAYAIARIVTAARAAGVECYDTPYTDVNDDEGLLADAKLARSLGFTGKISINPRHLDGINLTFSPTAEEIAYAHEVLDIFEEAKRQGKGAVALHGKMIDMPIVMRAQQVVAAELEINGGVGNG